MENERDCAEKALQSIKAEYMEPEMSKEQLEQLKKKIDQAKKENKKTRGNNCGGSAGCHVCYSAEYVSLYRLCHGKAACDRTSCRGSDFPKL